MASSESSKSQAQVSSEVAEKAKEAEDHAKAEAKDEAKDKAVASSTESTNASKAETVTVPVTTSTATAITSASSTSNTLTVPSKELPAATETVTATSSAPPMTSSTPSPATNPPATEPSATEPPATEPPATRLVKEVPVETTTASKEELADSDSLSDSSSDNDPPRKQVTKENEVFIAVVGQTGAGKSSFINWVTGANLSVGHGLASCTQVVQAASTFINGQAVTLIDTPGFDDTYKQEGEIINLIAGYLKHSYDRAEYLSGVIYLHQITDNRVGMASRKTMILLQKMCGVDNFKKIVLVTTRWDDLKDEKDGERREIDLETNPEFWAPMIAEGAMNHRHDNTRDSAVDIVKQIIPKSPAPLKMQMELSSERATVGGTQAGEHFVKYLQDQKKEIEENPGLLKSLDRKTTLDDQAITKRIDEDIAYMNKPVGDLLAQAQKAGLEREDGVTVAGEVTEENGVANSDGLPPRKPLLQKLFDMLTWMDLRVKST